MQAGPGPRGISRQTFSRWRRRYDPLDLTNLEARPQRPKRRRPTWSPALVQRFLAVRRHVPRWGKERSAVFTATPA